MLSVKISFYPIRLAAYQRGQAEMEIVVKNNTPAAVWIECDAKVPEALSLAPDRQLSAGRSRMGIAMPGEAAKKKIRIYSGPATYPDNHRIAIVVFAYGADGAIAHRQEQKTELRCVKFGEE